jgi:zinc transport system permease protein
LVSGVGGLVTSYYMGNSAGAAISLMLAVIFGITFALRKVRS